jgi:ribose transport system substrate-binding protein
MLGVRRQLSGNPQMTSSSRLRGEGGWREPDRCPFFGGDHDPERAVKQLALALSDLKVDVAIAVGGFPVVDAKLFRDLIGPLRAARVGAEQDIIVATGELTADQRALLRDGLVRAYLAIDFVEMGRASYRTMKQLAAGRRVEPVVRTGTQAHQR